LEETIVRKPHTAASAFRWLAALAMAATIGSALPGQAQELTVGVTGTTSDAPYFIADKKGFFKDEGISVRFINFDSAAKMIAPLGAGQLDVGGGATSAALYNAVKREVNIKIVADKARNSKNHGFQSFLVRKALHESGKITSLKDLKGVKVAISAAGNSEAVLVNELMKKGGYTFKDVEPVYLGFAQHPVAHQNGAVDISLTTEPTTSFILKQGTAVKLIGIDELYPNYQTAVTFYGDSFIKSKPEAAKKFMKAIVRGFRFYNDALKEGRLVGPNADEVIAIMTEYATLKDPAVYRAIISHGIDPDGGLDTASLQRAWEFFRDEKLIDGSVPLDKVIDLSFVKAAVAELGPYKPKETQ
jgi:NitT/TauT family transport system substrate-binding protein